MINDEYANKLNEILASVREMNAQVQKELAEEEKADRERYEKYEETARRGELGEDWKKIQERIDKGETTLSDVFSGKDTSEAADSLRQTAQRNITRAMQQVRQEAEENDEEDPFAALQEKLSALSKATEERVRHFQGF